MNPPGNRRNASGQQHQGRANAGSSSSAGEPFSPVVLAPVHGGGGGNISINHNNIMINNINNEISSSHQVVPATNVVRTMRRVIPNTGRISDEAKEAVQKCVAEFIGFITSEANERCRFQHRKTVTPEDIIYAMSKLGFDDYVKPLTLYLNRYREFESRRTSVHGEPSVIRTVDYDPNQQASSSSSSLLPPSSPPPQPLPMMPFPMYLFNPNQVGFPLPPPPPPFYFINPQATTTIGYAPAGGDDGNIYDATNFPPPSKD